MTFAPASTATFPACLSEAEALALHEFQDWLDQVMPGQTRRLILFGSKARGDTHAESDVDLLLELEESTPTRRSAITEFVVDTVLATGADLNVLVYSREALADEVAVGMPLVRNVAADGIALWGEPIMVTSGKPAEAARRLLASAREHIRIAKSNAEVEGRRAAISEAYYAFLDAADAALAAKKITTKSHAGTIDLFGLHFIKNGPVGAKYSKWFQRAREWRLEGDYKRKLDWTDEQVRTAIESAEEFVNLIEALIPTLLTESDDDTQPDSA